MRISVLGTGRMGWARAEERDIAGSGGIFRDMHVHDCDLARWMTGREVATVSATGAVRGFERFARHGDAGTSACPAPSALEALRVAVACDRSRAECRPVSMADVA